MKNLMEILVIIVNQVMDLMKKQRIVQNVQKIIIQMMDIVNIVMELLFTMNVIYVQKKIKLQMMIILNVSVVQKEQDIMKKVVLNVKKNE